MRGLSHVAQYETDLLYVTLSEWFHLLVSFAMVRYERLKPP